MDGTNNNHGTADKQDSDTSSLEEQTTVTASPGGNNGNLSSINPEDANSLDANTGDGVEPTGGLTVPTGSVSAEPAATPTNHGFMHRLMDRLNVYLLLFILLIILSAATGTILYLKASNQANNAGSSPSQSLSQTELSQLADSDVTVGGPQSTLNVQSNAVFSGSVLVHSNLQVAGTLQVGNSAANTGLRVTGNSTFDDVQITKSLALTGNGSIQGQLNVQGNLGVTGSGTFNGNISAPQITVSTIQLNGDLDLTHHIDAGGSTPSRSYGTALGSGGSASVSGSDTAGSVTINTGSSPAVGCFVTITFTAPFNSTPHIVITPVGSSAAGLAYYINRSTTNFSICTTSTPPSSVSFGFDYIAFD
jgi:cytoskeletal protein CcmA (bactofilin family)